MTEGRQLGPDRPRRDSGAGRASRPVSLDRLADFVGGALTGTPDEEEVRHLVDTDQAWAAGYRDMIDAAELVANSLGALSAEPIAIPPDVAERLVVALDVELAATRAVTAVPGPAPRPDPGQPVRVPAQSGLSGRVAAQSGPARPTTRQRAVRRPGATRGGILQRLARPERWRWRWRVAVPVAITAIGLGLSGTIALRVGSSGGGGSQSVTADQAGSARNFGESPMVDQSAPTVLMSGVNYTKSTLTLILSRSKQRVSAGPEAPAAATNNDDGRELSRPAPPGLNRFADSSVLTSCSAAIITRHGGAVSTIDLARFEGQPALVALIIGAPEAAGRPLIVVAGTDCGSAPGRADEWYVTTG